MPWHIRMVVQIFALLLIAYIYLGFRMSRAIAPLFNFNPKRTRMAVFATLLLLNLHPLAVLMYQLSGNGGSIYLLNDHLEWQDYLFTFPFWISTIAVVELLPYYLLIDIIDIPLRFFKPFYRNRWPRRRAVLQVLLPLLFFFYTGFRIYNDTCEIRTREFSMKLKGLPPSLDQLSITLVGDIQADRYTGRRKLEQSRQVVARANSDILLFAGDLVTYGQHYIPRGVQSLCGMNAPVARIACMGDHDYWADPLVIPRQLQACGWQFLQDQHYLFKYNGATILVTGITYIYSKRPGKAYLKKVLSSAPTADLKILLVHQPATAVIEMAKEFGYQLLVGGHTHGGQLVFHPFGFKLTPTRFENSFFSGYKNFGGLHAVITNGIGLTLAPVRYGAPSEICKITLSPE